MIAIVNYGLGNMQAFVNIYRRLNLPIMVASTAQELAPAEKIILPGVGAFDWAMTRLNESGMRDCLDDLVLHRGCPVLGICVGMQIMAEGSDEGERAGLGWIQGRVRKFDGNGLSSKSRLPHMGWNEVAPQRGDSLFRGMGADSRFYFLHSYYFLPRLAEEVLGVTEYCGHPFASAVRWKSVFGVQFHPEKSHQWGIQLLRNFAEF
jgi:glutamine amidotransferase